MGEKKELNYLPKVQLADLILEAQSGFASGKRDEEGIAQIRMNNVTTDGQLDFSSIRRVPVDATKNVQRFFLNEGDILFNSTNSPQLVGKTALFKMQDEPFVFSNHFVRIAANPKRLDSSYLARWLTQQQQKGYFASICTQWVNQASVRKEDLLSLEIPLPPLAEQKRLARILDVAAALQSQRRATLTYLDTLLQSTFLHMFGDPVTNPKLWTIETLDDLVEFRTGKLDSNAAVLGGQYPFFTCAREDSSIDIYAFDCEALLLAGNNATADYSVKHYAGKFNAYQRTYVITLKDTKVTYPYMRLALEYKLAEMKRLSKGTNTRYLTLAILKPLQVQVPNKVVLEKFGKAYEAILQKQKFYQLILGHQERLFASLQQRAFRGELSPG